MTVMSNSAAPSSAPTAPKRGLLAHPEDLHCVVFDLVLKVSYLAAFTIWLKWDAIPSLAATGTAGKVFFGLAAALMLGWCNGINVGVNFHNHAHRKIFTKPWLNSWFGRFWTISGGWPAYLWQHSHVVVHHVHLLHEQDWTIMRRKADGTFENIYKYSVLHWPWRYVRGLLKDVETGRYGPIGGRMAAEAAFFFLVFAIPFVVDWRMGLMLWLLPAFLGNAMVMGPGMYAQHVDCVPKSKQHPYTHSNTFVNSFFNLTMFNIGYHIEHHDHPMVHWSDLPALHAQLKDEEVAAGAHVVPYGYYRSGQLLCQATFSTKAAEAWKIQHPDYLRKTPAEAASAAVAPPVAPAVSR